MSTQAALLLLSLQGKPYFKNASTMYEKFVNKKWKETSLIYNS